MRVRLSTQQPLQRFFAQGRSRYGDNRLRFNDSRLIDMFADGAYVVAMDPDFVSLHPYFKVHPGKLEAVKAMFSRFIEKTATEKENLFYGFTINGDEILCREAYRTAAGVLAHLDNVGAPLREMLTMADLVRIELHGPAEELDKLKGPLAHLNPAWFTLERSLRHSESS